MQTIKYICNNSKRIPIMGENMSANKIAQLPQVKGQIGKTGILELLRGDKKNVKGFSIVEDRAPDRANKLGVEYIGTGRLRQRKPMRIYIKPCPGRGMSDRCTGDFRAFLTACYALSKTSYNNMVEYNEVGKVLEGWSRNMVAIYAARAKTLGYVTTVRESGKL